MGRYRRSGAWRRRWRFYQIPDRRRPAMLDRTAQAVLDRVDAERVANLALDLVKIRSYTGETLEASEFYVETLRLTGLHVDVYADFPRTPSIVGRLKGSGGGKSLEL